MNYFTKICLCFVLVGPSFPAHGRSVSEQSALNKPLVTVSIDSADIRAVQEELNRLVPAITFNLETDRRDVAMVTLHAQDIPLSKLLDDVCDALHYRWEYDPTNRAINLFPGDTQRYTYYPFALIIPPIDIDGKDKIEVVAELSKTTLLKEKYPLLLNLHYSETARKNWKRFHGTIENVSLRQALNWICANSDGNTYWRSGYSEALGLASFGFGSKSAPMPAEPASVK